jgi:hypothetical protein
MPKGVYNHKLKEIEYIVDNEGCHICTSHSIDTSGYPQIQKDKKRYNAHRYVYEQIHGKQSKNTVIRHTCDNRKCINPKHLLIGTPMDNSRDMVKRGRVAKGSSNGSSKLNEDKVLEIIESNLSTYKLSEIYGVSRQLIGLIKKRAIWKHVI